MQVQPLFSIFLRLNFDNDLFITSLQQISNLAEMEPGFSEEYCFVLFSILTINEQNSPQKSCTREVEETLQDISVLFPVCFKSKHVL